MTFRVLTIMGTRPEAIKLAPVVGELAARDAFEQIVVATGQHRQMLDQALDLFGIRPDVDLDLMQQNQGLGEFASRALAALTELFERTEPDCVLVQGDTTTVMAAALAAFYLGIPVGHVEAGLRSFDLRNPFPEELNRKVAGCAAALHFAPTERARENLVREGADPGAVFVTGNTIVDALELVRPDVPFVDPALELVDLGGRVLLVTAHRRENHGAPLRSICRALGRLAAEHEDLQIVYPVHLNPSVRSVVDEELADNCQIHLVDPLCYSDLLGLMRGCWLILTDSGGIQEEAPSFRKPVLVLRDATERPELIEAGLGRLIGVEEERIVEEASALLTDDELYARMSDGQNPFGDGLAASRIAGILERELAATGARATARISA